MRGSVVKRDTRYYVKIELDPDPITGKRRSKWHSGYRTRREAEKARVDLLSKFDRGEYVEPTQQSVADYLTGWLAAIEHTVRLSTFDSYSRNMHNHVIAHIGSIKLTKVDAGVLNGLYALLLTSGRRRPSRTGRGYSPAVVERALELRVDGMSLAATAEQLQTEFDEAEHITKDTLASLLRRQLQRRAVDELPDGLDRRTGQLRPHNPPPCVQGCGPLGTPRPQSGRRRRPATRRPKGRRRSRVGRRDAAHVPRADT